MYLDRMALTSAGIHDPLLRESYEFCRRLLVAFGDGKDIWRGSLLLPPERRPHLWAVYGFARHFDELVDGVDSAVTERAFSEWRDVVLTDVGSGHSCEPSVRALIHTLGAWDIDPASAESLVKSHLNAHLMDLRVTEYATWEDLQQYLRLMAVETFFPMVLAIMGPLSRPAGEEGAAIAQAVHWTNMIRDVAEDQRLGRTYLPLEDLDRFGVSRQDLARGRTTPAIRDLVKFEVDRAHSLYERGADLPDLVHPQCQGSFKASLVFYRSYLTEIERRDYDVLTAKPRIGHARQAQLLLRAGVPLLRSRVHRSVTPTGVARRRSEAAGRLPAGS
ncbi:phytoene/squalene synthase family protein [Streptomyces halobius]|uniref:Squalene/phytoene synthase family protein n=1 Tax=Streptomyces halobius TaxID=2879846 RepID=A0ABY4M2R7_9ACTN|nr:phytoene/squalene synthase family protein [Streptomyces halobius]UQA90640.1 squalene/phytoene synthase family protein [Streptomyces halobius]